MIHPKRLLEGEGTELERLLLASGRAARPRARAKWRTGILFLFMGLGTVSKAHAVAFLGAKVRAWTIAQWLAVGVGTGVAGWVTVHPKAEVQPAVVAVADPQPRRTAASSAVSHEPARVEPLPALPPAPVNVEPISASMPPLAARPPAPAPGSRAKRSTASATAPERSIASEIEELDRARDALGTGEPKRAIDRLNRYDRLFPQGVMREEALRLRIEAFVTTGERATARSLAQRFQALYPDSTHSERLKALVREP